MEALNHTLFLWLNAAHPSAEGLLLGRFLAKSLVYFFPAYVAISWVRADAPGRDALLQGVLSACIAMLLSWAIARAWFHPRPFVIGLGQQYLAHQPTASFPSNHLSFIWALCAGLALHPARRRVALLLALLGLPIAWARIYVGIHFPLDMLGAIPVALLAAMLSWPAHQALIPGLRQRIVEPLYRWLCAWPIRKGWFLR